MKLRLAGSEPPALHSSDPEFKRRIDRYAALRAARRAMSAPLGLGAHDDAEGDTIRTALELLVADPPGDPDRLIRELGGLDTVLARYARSLRSRFAEVPVPQLRATLPTTARRNRQEVVALVELLLEDDADVERNLAALDFLFTLLCFEDRYGQRQVTRDPTTLSAGIQAACGRRLDTIDEALMSRSELRFYGFAELEVGRTDVEQQIGELRDLKRELGGQFLHPRLLRAVVTYNVAVWNRLERFLENERASDPAWDASEATGPDHESGSGESLGGADDSSFLLNAAVSSVAEALSQRIAGQTTSNSLSARIAGRLDLARLDDAQRALIGRHCPGGALDLRPAAILLGLLLAAIPIAADELEEAGLDPRMLQSDWVREIDEALRRIGKEALGEGWLENACEISETRTQFIHEPLMLISKTLRDHYRPPVVEEEAKAKRPGFAMAGLRLGRDFALEVLRSVDIPIWKKDYTTPSRRYLSTVLPVVLCALVLWIVMGGWDSRDKVIREFGTGELARISIYLEDGYRDRKGVGPLFVGRLKESWDALSPSERRREAEGIVGALREHEVEQVMIYGGRKTLEVQYHQRRLLRPSASKKS